MSRTATAGRCLAVLAAALLGSAGAMAQDYPSRAIQMIVPYPPGGNTDLMGRALQTELSKALAQSVVIVNRGGAAGAIGDAELARARPDGYTIALSPNNPLTAQPHLQSLNYGVDSFRYICLVYDNPQVLVAGRNAPFQDIPGMLAFARSKPEALVFGTPGQGSTQHILLAAMLKLAGTDGLHVPYTGAGPMAQAAIAGQIMAFVESPSIPAATGLPVLAVFGAGRLASLPSVPTTQELGLPVQGSSAGGLIAPAGIPEAAAKALETACATAVNSEGFRLAAERLNSAPAFLPGSAFQQRFQAESRDNQRLLQELGLGRN